ncbi:4-alpha-glucanotransferase [Streptomyces sp. NPDC060194]|uniref:4-alpha-glucanotransferase n=1 Tax=Streptomyces sp. NPDC060194 TaxID=3347069 RepID=UPI00364CD82A
MERPADQVGSEGSAPLDRLAALHGVATSYSPAPGEQIRSSHTAIVAVLASLGVDATTPVAVSAALERAETEARTRLLPPTLVLWEPDGEAPTTSLSGPVPSTDTGIRADLLAAALGDLPPGTALRLETEDGRVREWIAPRSPGEPAEVVRDLPPVPEPPPEAEADAADEADDGPPPHPEPGSLPDLPEALTVHGGPTAPVRSPLTGPTPSTIGPPSANPPAPAPPAPLSAKDTEPREPAPAPERVRAGEAALPGPLPLGVHALHATAPDGRRSTAHLIVAPPRVPQPPERTHGLLVQLYSLLSSRSWGMGDLGDLTDLADWAGRTLGAGFIQVNPLHAAVPGGPDGATDPSPYRPSSRRFPDPVHLRIEDVPEYSRLAGEAREQADQLLARAAALRTDVLEKDALIDRDAVWALKQAALEIVRTVPLGPGRRAAYCDFLAEPQHARALEDHATWYALAERYGPDRDRWPAGLQDARSAQTARARAELMDRIDFHTWAAWLTDGQLARAQRTAREAGMGVGLVHDLAVGVHPGGADTWGSPDAYARGMSVGAPPDAFNARGQDWGLPPWRPDALAATGYAPYRGLLKSLCRHAGALRIDHVMGLFRLWWVPEGHEPVDGAYVRYDAEAMLAVLALEAHRAGAVVIGEDLGTVEPGVRESLELRGVLGTSVLWFERDWTGDRRPLPPETWRAGCVATATTHDLPPTASRLTGDHVELRHRLGLLTTPLAEELAAEGTDVREWVDYLARLGLLPEGREDEEAAVRAVYRFLLATSARMVGVWLPDAVGDRRPQNLPGTTDEYPNWRLPVAGADGRPLTLEQLAASPRLHALMEVFREPGASAPEGSVPGGPSRTDPPGARPL